MKCIKCGESFERLLMMAMVVDAGARVHPNPLVCCKDGGEHDLREPPKDQVPHAVYSPEVERDLDENYEPM